MEVGQAVLALDLVYSQLDLSESVVFVVLEVGQGDLENSALEGIVGVLETGGSVYEGLADTTIFVSPCPSFDISSGCAYSLTLNVDGAFKLYQSFRAKGSWVRFLRPFLPFDSLLFLR